MGGPAVSWGAYSYPDEVYNVFRMDESQVETLPEFRQEQAAFHREYMEYIIGKDYLAEDGE